MQSSSGLILPKGLKCREPERRWFNDLPPGIDDIILLMFKVHSTHCSITVISFWVIPHPHQERFCLLGATGRKIDTPPAGRKESTSLVNGLVLSHRRQMSPLLGCLWMLFIETWPSAHGQAAIETFLRFYCSSAVVV